HGSRIWTRGTEGQKILLKQNCGTIYEKHPPYHLVYLPFYKFWNYNEPLSSARAAGTVHWTYYTEKLDGTRDMTTPEELEVDIGVQKPRLIPFSSFDECLKYMNQMRFAEGK
ncbi:unnamed protein product, partial [Didymodactylos carnosus]